MKIAVASNNQKDVTGHLGRCRGFIIYDITGGEIISKEYRTNTFTHHHHGSEAHTHEHGHGNHSHSELLEGLKDCSIVIFNSGGWRIIEDLKANGIYPFLTNETSADTAVDKYIRNELVEEEGNACKGH